MTKLAIIETMLRLAILQPEPQKECSQDSSSMLPGKALEKTSIFKRPYFASVTVFLETRLHHFPCIRMPKGVCLSVATNMLSILPGYSFPIQNKDSTSKTVTKPTAHRNSVRNGSNEVWLPTKL